jgi:hypothetical protein
VSEEADEQFGQIADHQGGVRNPAAARLVGP